MWKSVYTDLLQTEDECLGTLNLVDLPSLTHSLLDDVTIIIVILQIHNKKKNTLRGHEDYRPCMNSCFTSTSCSSTNYLFKMYSNLFLLQFFNDKKFNLLSCTV